MGIFLEKLSVYIFYPHRIRGKILSLFALLILGAFLLSSVAMILSHRMYFSMLTVREESRNTRRMDALRITLLDFLVSQYLELPVDEKEAEFRHLSQKFLGTLGAYIYKEQALQTSESRQELALLLQIRDSFLQTIVPQAHEISLARQHGVEEHSAGGRQLREATATAATGLEQVVAVHEGLEEKAIRRAEQDQQRLIGLCFALLVLGLLTLFGVHSLLYRIIINPLQHLNAAILRMAQGGFKERVLIRGTREFSELATSFNTMATQLEAHENMRRAFHQELEATVNERTRDLRVANQELRRTQMRLLEAERIATIGEIAASVTHEIRQPLNSLAISFQLIKRVIMEDLPTLNAKLAEPLRLLGYDIERINHVITAFMRSAQVSQSYRQPMELAKTIRNVMQLLEGEAASAQVTLQYQDDEVLPSIVADENNIGQLLINLILNAIQAQVNGGTVVVSTHYEPQEMRVHILIQDSGPGIATEDLEKIWKPFFTTKATGIGLGLGIARRIGQAHSGDITCTSVLGQGTCFEVALPVEDTGTQTVA